MTSDIILCHVWHKDGRKKSKNRHELGVYLIPPAHFTDKLFDTQRSWMMCPNQSVIALGWEFRSPGLFPLWYFVNFLLSLYSFQHQAQSFACRKNSVNGVDYWFLDLSNLCLKGEYRVIDWESISIFNKSSQPLAQCSKVVKRILGSELDSSESCPAFTMWLWIKWSFLTSFSSSKVWI